MSFIYNYSIINDFPNGLNVDQLGAQIENSVIITSPFDGIVVFGDDVTIRFDVALTVPEVTELDTIISNHDPIEIIHRSISKRVWIYRTMYRTLVQDVNVLVIKFGKDSTLPDNDYVKSINLNIICQSNITLNLYLTEADNGDVFESVINHSASSLNITGSTSPQLVQFDFLFPSYPKFSKELVYLYLRTSSSGNPIVQILEINIIDA